MSVGDLGPVVFAYDGSDLARLAICAQALGDPAEVTLADFIDEAAALDSLLHREV